VHAKWDTVLQELWVKSRFTSYFYQSVHFEKDETVPTLSLAATKTGFVLRYNDTFPDAFSLDELTGLLAHEMMHVMLNHNHRVKPGKNVLLQNLAQDMVINSYMLENKARFFSRAGRDLRDEPEVILPDSLPLVPDRFYTESGGRYDPSWEEVYEWLDANRDEKITEVTDKSQNGVSTDSRFETPDFSFKEKAFGDEIIPDFFNDTSGVIFKSKSARELPAGVHFFREKALDDTVDALKKRIISFTERDENSRAERLYQEISSLISRIRPAKIKNFNKVVKRFLNQVLCGDDWDFSARRFNRRYFGEGLYAPGRFYRRQPSLTVAVDVSGSMLAKPETIERAFGVIESLLGRYAVHLICIDEAVFVPQRSGDTFIAAEELSGEYLYRRGDWRYIKTARNAATFFKPLFDTFMKDKKEPLIIITDGEVYDMDRLTPYRHTLWAVPPECSGRIKPPFGRVVAIE
jgi:predicted metal-dependent peptidase